MTNKNFTRAVLLFLTPTLALAQEQLGLRMERYAGVNSLMHNPANNLVSPLKWDVNLVELGVFVDNNYAFIYNATIFHTPFQYVQMTVLSNKREDAPLPNIVLEVPTLGFSLFLEGLCPIFWTF